MKLDLNDLNLGAVGDFFKHVWQDLVNRRLLPVAIALVVALIAVPLVLGRSSSSVPAGPVVATATGDKDAKVDPVSLSEKQPGGELKGDPARNPFIQHKSEQTSTTATSSTPAASTTTATTPAATGGTGSGTGTTTTGTSKKKSSSSVPSTGYTINVKFGPDGKTVTKNNVTALTPFPSADNAYVVYLGQIDSGKTSVFLVSTDVKPTGDGICNPSETTCKEVEMRKGDTELFAVNDTTDALFVSYELKLLKIKKK